MATIECKPDNVVVDVSDNETILRACRRAGVPMAHVCGGKGRCTTCRIFVEDNPGGLSVRQAHESDIAAKMNFSPEIRLACQAKARDNVTIRRLVLDELDIQIASRFIDQSARKDTGSEKYMFIMFADIRGFTPLSESLLPYDVIHILNRYFHAMGKVVSRGGGYIDNYIGDGLMALFEGNDPRETAIRTIQAGLDMLKTVDRDFRPYVQNLWNRDFNIGIGLHCGPVIAGALGCLDNRRMTVIGDAVNFASRIEAANKTNGTRFLISKDVKAFVSDRLQIKQEIETSIPGKAGLHVLVEVGGLRESST